jgi:hypothetical protein
MCDKIISIFKQKKPLSDIIDKYVIQEEDFGYHYKHVFVEEMLTKIREKKEKGRLIGLFEGAQNEIFALKEGEVETQVEVYRGNKSLSIEELFQIKIKDEKKYLQYEVFVAFNGNDAERVFEKGDWYVIPLSYFYYYASTPYSVKDKKGNIVLVKSPKDYLINHQDDISEFLIFGLTTCLLTKEKCYHILKVIDNLWVFGKKKKKQVMMMQPIELTLESLLQRGKITRTNITIGGEFRRRIPIILFMKTIIFQVSFTILSYNGTYGIIHGDLAARNIFLKLADEPDLWRGKSVSMSSTLQYTINGVSFVVDNFLFQPKIGDWGFSMKVVPPTPILSFVAHRIKAAYHLPNQLSLKEINIPEYDLHFFLDDLYKFFPDHDEMTNMLDDMVEFLEEGNLMSFLMSPFFEEFRGSQNGSLNLGVFP